MNLIERGKLDNIRPHYWQTDTSVSFKSWCYIEGDEFRTVASTVHDLVDIVSKNGNLLLNVGPRPDGTIPQEAQDVLLGLGRWLDLNGEAIYGARPWRVYGEGPTGIPKAFREHEQAAYTTEDVRLTTKGDTLYAILLGWPAGQATIKSLNSDAVKANAVSMLGFGGRLAWSQDAQGLTVTMPAQKPCAHAFTLKIKTSH
ncbi:MAG: alpha-L-fucosidase [Anaerolineae bacterium]|nr:alpha-L-fucosidase [Anaerolineae bacterium]